MKIVLADNRRYIVRFDKGEEVITGLQAFMAEQAWEACALSGVGASGEIELGYFNSFLKDYRKKRFMEDLEVIAFNGNGTMCAGQPIIHVHGMFGRTDFTTLGGHIFKLIVSVTMEIFLIKLEGKIERQPNSEFGINLLI